MLVSILESGAEVVATVRVPKSKRDGVNATNDPNPSRLTVSGLEDELTLIERVPVREPAAVGINVMLTVQLASATRLLLQLLLAI